MQYWGKIIGVAVALIMGGGFWGVVLGLLIGHMFDKARSRKMAWFANQRERQALFFATTFEVMGHLTKSKGRVTEADIHIANVLMDRMNLHGESRSAAQNAFRVGKSDNYPLREKMRQFRSVCFGRFDLIRMFLEIQIQAAFADGSLHPNEREVLYVIAEELGQIRGILRHHVEPQFAPERRLPFALVLLQFNQSGQRSAAAQAGAITFAARGGIELQGK